MGSFLTNVQVKVQAADAALDRVAKAISAGAAQAGFTPIDAPADASRTVVLVAHSGKPWIGVYDQSTEDQGGGHEKLAEQLSKDLGGQTIATLVHDSDVLTMRLFDSGRALD